MYVIITYKRDKEGRAFVYEIRLLKSHENII